MLAKKFRRTDLCGGRRRFDKLKALSNVEGLRRRRVSALSSIQFFNREWTRMDANLDPMPYIRVHWCPFVVNLVRCSVAAKPL
jgi:hypothetical protein